MEINISIQKKSYLNISDYLFFILKLCITILVAPLEIQKYNKISAFADIIIRHQDAVPTKMLLWCCSYDYSLYFVRLYVQNIHISDNIIRHQDAFSTKMLLQCCFYDLLFVLSPSVSLKYPHIRYIYTASRYNSYEKVALVLFL